METKSEELAKCVAVLMSYAKPLNLYLYLPPSSAHPPGLLKGHIFGHIKKLYMQNTEFGNFRRFSLQFFERLMARGHSRDQLIRLFNQALQRYCPTVEVLFAMDNQRQLASSSRMIQTAHRAGS